MIDNDGNKVSKSMVTGKSGAGGEPSLNRPLAGKLQRFERGEKTKGGRTLGRKIACLVEEGTNIMFDA